MRTIVAVITLAMITTLVLGLAGCGRNKEPIEGQWGKAVYKADGTIEHFVSDDSAKAS